MTRGSASPPGVPAAPAARDAARTGSLHVETLQVRVAGADAAAGRRFAAELGAELSRQAAAIAPIAGTGPVELDRLKLSLRSGPLGPNARRVSSTLLRAIERTAGTGQTRTR